MDESCDATVMQAESTHTSGDESTPLDAGLSQETAKRCCRPGQALRERLRPWRENESTPE